MRIIFLTYDLPYPLNSGGKIRSYYLIKSLSKKYKITLFSYYREEAQRKYLPEIKKYCEEISLFKREKPWRWQNIWRCLVSNLPFAAAVYSSLELEEALIKELRQKDYQAVHFESFYPALYLPMVKKLGAKTVMGNENIEYRIYERFAATRKIIFVQWLLKVEIWRMRVFEENLWRQAEVNLAPSAEDATMIEKITHKSCLVIPNGVDADCFKTPRKTHFGNTLIFVGTLVYQANSDAMRYFLDEIYPKIKRALPAVKLIIASWHKPDWLGKYLSDISIEFLPDKATPIQKILAKGDLFVAPIRVASGTNIKILEAMAAGLPVVTTTVGIEGLEVQKEEVVVADKPDDFAREAVALLKDHSRQIKLAQAGQALVIKNYDWTKIGNKLRVVYQGLLND